MTHSSLATRTLATSKFSDRKGLTPRRLIVHHCGSTSNGNDTYLATGDNDKSATYCLRNDNVLVGIVPEEHRPWTTGGHAYDGDAITVEVVNSTAGPEWAVTGAQLETIACLAADLSARYGWGPLTRTTVVGHREANATTGTACPGPYLLPRLDDIVRRANELLGSTAPAKPAATSPQKDKLMLPIPFATHTTYAGHSGVDFPYATGTLVRASGNGRVTYRGWLNGNAGNSVIVQYDGGPAVLACHFNHLGSVPAVGTRVSEGSVIGSVGSTGRSTGPHLHLEIMEGSGAHTNAGIWRHFTSGRVVGSGGSGLTFSQEVQNQQAWMNASRGEKLVVDGLRGPDTIAAIKRYQSFLGVDADGEWGPKTQEAHQRHYDKSQGSAAPAFPLPSGWFFGPASGPTESVSGFHGNGEHLQRWQQRMKDRGWNITPDGRYGNQTRDVAIAFQREKGLGVDGRIGPETWAAAWTAPVS